jgi:hypothetical protein
MASISPTRIAGLAISPIRTPPASIGFSARFVGSLINAGGGKIASGRTYVSGSPKPRRVVIMTQPPQAKVIFESNTLLPGATFVFPKLAPGRYLVLDCTVDGSEQALVYDWVLPV